MLRTLNGEARKHGTWPTSIFQLHQTSVNILYVHAYYYFLAFARVQYLIVLSIELARDKHKILNYRGSMCSGNIHDKYYHTS